MECLLPYLCMVTVPHTMVGLERMLDYRGVGLARLHCIWTNLLCYYHNSTYNMCILILYYDCYKSYSGSHIITSCNESH